MSEKQFNAYMEALRSGTREMCATKESARAFLMEAGIVDQNGYLTEPYRQPDVQSTPESASRLSRV